MEAVFDYASFLKVVSVRPGVYKMYNQAEEIIYVGKASNLRKRLSSYFKTTVNHVKTRALVGQIANIDVVVTRNEVEALLLEFQLIKKHRPRYNVLLRDDKSYPYIYVSDQQAYPRLAYYRGGRKEKGRYIGPYPNVKAVKSTLHFVQKLFRVRQCEDSYFANRSRPCLQYQIARCSAPCVQAISEVDYRRDVDRSVMLLEGKNRDVIEQLSDEMANASECLDFERAAELRDQVAALSRVSEKQYISRSGGNVDIVAAVVEAGVACVQVFFVRNGVILGNKAFFPRLPKGESESDLLYGFLTQFYLQHDIPDELIVNHVVGESALLGDVFSQRKGTRVVISSSVKGQRARWLEMAKDNANVSLSAKLSSKTGQAVRLNALREILQMDALPERMECFDISHTSGESTVASCVVFNAEGALKQDYRRFNIEGVTPGDDYAAMRQVLERRYTRIIKEDALLPDVVFIDGGAGQLAQARQVFEELQLEQVCLVGVAKGPERRPGEETLILANGADEFQCDSDNPGLHLVQQIRDEAHRFAITGHRAKRAKKRQRSVLEDIPGLGPKRRSALLRQFGGLQGLQRAGIEDIAAVAGISVVMAEKIYTTLHAS